MLKIITLFCFANFAFAVAAETCEPRLNENSARITSTRALTIPAQLGFVREDLFARTLLETRGRFVSHLGDDGRAWSLALEAIYPANGLSSVAYFHAVHHDRNTRAAHAPESEPKTLEVQFATTTGAVESFAVHDGRVAVPANVRVAHAVEREIDTLTRELTLKLQGGDYSTKINAERAETHRRLRVGRAFCANNRATIWIEVHLKVLTENSAGGLFARTMNLVYAISPNQHVHLRAADDPDVRPLISN